jgi:hypothetical protein
MFVRVFSLVDGSPTEVHRDGCDDIFRGKKLKGSTLFGTNVESLKQLVTEVLYPMDEYEYSETEWEDLEFTSEIIVMPCCDLPRELPAPAPSAVLAEAKADSQFHGDLGPDF